jgi:hypothetical protein
MISITAREFPPSWYFGPKRPRCGDPSELAGDVDLNIRLGFRAMLAVVGRGEHGSLSQEVFGCVITP